MLGKFTEKEKKNDEDQIISMESLKEGLVAIGTTYNKIKIWKILDSKHKFIPKCIYTMYDQAALYLHFDSKANILFAGESDNTIQCFLVDDFDVKGQYFLKLVINGIKNPAFAHKARAGFFMLVDKGSFLSIAGKLKDFV